MAKFSVKDTVRHTEGGLYRVIVAPPHATMKIGTEWEDAYIYKSATVNGMVFVREAEEFEQQFTQVEESNDEKT